VVVFVLALASAHRAVAEEEGNPAGEVILAESDFMWDVDGWTTRGAAENFQHGQKMIKASDKGPDTWYFVAPSKFLGAKRAAYGGKLSFRHGFFEYNRCLDHLTTNSPPFPKFISPPIVEMLLLLETLCSLASHPNTPYVPLHHARRPRESDKGCRVV
jgi:hypothetical protein